MVPVLAEMMDRGDMGNGGAWWAWLIGALVLLILVALVAFAVVRMTAASGAPPARSPERRSADELLAERFARGEIDEDEFRRRREALRD